MVPRGGLGLPGANRNSFSWPEGQNTWMYFVIEDEAVGHKTRSPSQGRAFCFLWCPEAESNHRHADFQSAALPTELSGQRGVLNGFRLTKSTYFLIA